MGQQVLGPQAPQASRLFKGRPFALQGHPHRLRVLFAHRPTAPGAVLAPFVVGNPPNNAPQPFRQWIRKLLIPQDLGSLPQMQGGGIPLPLIRRRLPHMGKESRLQRFRLLPAPLRGAHHAFVDKRSDHRVVVGDAQVLQMVEGGSYLLGPQPRDPHQFVRGDPFVRGRIDQSFDDLQEFLAAGGRHGPLTVKPLPGLPE